MILMFQVMDNDRDMKVSIEELRMVLSNSTQGRKKMNSTLFRNLVEKSEKVIFHSISSQILGHPKKIQGDPKRL